MSAKPTRSVLSVVMNVVILLAVVLAVRVVIEFFGGLAAQEWADVVVRLTDIVTPPLGIAPISTPYGGVFDAEAAVTVAGLLLLEWGLGSISDRA